MCDCKQCAELKADLKARDGEVEELNRALDILPDVDESNEGWGGTLKENILCHLSMIDTDERFWELARKADAGHTRAVAHIVFRAFNRMVEEADRADAAEATCATLTKEVEERDRAEYIEAWAVLDCSGKFSHRDEAGIGIVHGVDYGQVEYMLDEVISYMEDADFDAPKGADIVSFRLENFSHQEGQMTFPETGQWDFPPHWEMDIEVIGYRVEGKDIDVSLRPAPNDEKEGSGS